MLRAAFVGGEESPAFDWKQLEASLYTAPQVITSLTKKPPDNCVWCIFTVAYVIGVSDVTVLVHP